MRNFNSGVHLPGVLALICALVMALMFIGCSSDDSTSPVEDADPPTIVITSPAAGSEIGGAVALTVTVTGTDLVRFYVDNNELGSDSTAPFSYSWNSGLVANGAHTLRARAEGPGGSVDVEMTVLVNNAAGTVIVTLSPNQVALETGQTQQFNATLSGTASTAVTWIVDGGAAWGTISIAGLYTAPATVPNPATATVRATSTVSPSSSGIATVDLSGTGGGGVDESEAFLCAVAFGGGEDAVDLGEDALEWVVQAVWLASELTGVNTFTGTLTQVAAGGEDFTYSSTPQDRLVVALVGATPLEFTITAFDGYVGGGWEDFLHSHEVEFSIRVAGSLELAIFSRTVPPKDGSWDWTRTYVGWTVYQGETVQFNLSDTGSESYTTGYSFAEGNTARTTTGTASTATISVVVDETFTSSLIHSSTAGTEARNFYLSSKSSATFDGHTYQYVGAEAGQPAAVQWETYTSFSSNPPTYNVVKEPDYWTRSGGLLKDGEVFGTLEFSGTVVYGSWGPDLVLRTTADGDIVLHTLIVEP